MNYSKFKFLVVDDSAMVRQHISQLLKRHGAARVDQAENGKEALLKIRKSVTESMPYNLVTLDCEMPEMSGQELLRKIRGDRALETTAVLIVSSLNDAEHIRSLVGLKPDGYIVKPFSDETFEAKVEQLLKLSL